MNIIAGRLNESVAYGMKCGTYRSMERFLKPKLETQRVWLLGQTNARHYGASLSSSYSIYLVVHIRSTLKVSVYHKFVVAVFCVVF